MPNTIKFNRRLAESLEKQNREASERLAKFMKKEKETEPVAPVKFCEKCGRQLVAENISSEGLMPVWAFYFKHPKYDPATGKENRSWQLTCPNRIRTRKTFFGNEKSFVDESHSQLFYSIR